MLSLSPIVYNPAPVNIARVEDDRPVNITKEEQKFIKKAFGDEQKSSRQKNTARRNDDNGYNAALTCLSRDMVTANSREAELIAAKMSFIQNLINQNLQIDANLKTQGNDDRIAIIESKSNAYTKKAPYRVEIIKTTADSITDVADTIAKDFIKP